MTHLKQTLLLCFALLLVACGGESTPDTAPPAQPDVAPEQSADIADTDAADDANAIEESITSILGGSEDETIDGETDAAMATVEALIDEREDEGQNDANSGGDASDEYDTPTLIEPGSYSGAATFGVDQLSLDMRDVYRVNASAGETVRVTVTNTQAEFSTDFDIYDHTGERVYVGLFEAGTSESAEFMLTEDGYVDIVLTAQQYDFMVTATVEAVAEAVVEEVVVEEVAAAVDFCGWISAEILQQALATESEPIIEASSDDCAYTFAAELVTLILSAGQEGDISFYRNAGGEEIALGDDATYINTQGQSILVWSDAGVVYQIAGLDFMNGMVSAEILTQIAQSITP